MLFDVTDLQWKPLGLVARNALLKLDASAPNDPAAAPLQLVQVALEKGLLASPQLAAIEQRAGELAALTPLNQLRAIFSDPAEARELAHNLHGREPALVAAEIADRLAPTPPQPA